ncbi:MAG: MBOAT family protein, partial [Eubacterium sp.]|nr:MBOAT family protein [Eubacterium sp.]
MLYYICPVRFRNVVLLIASLFFYAWGEPVYILIMLFSTVFDYINGRLLDVFKKKASRRIVLIISVVGNLGILFFFKYRDFLVESINSITGTQMSLWELALPIGISFYT